MFILQLYCIISELFNISLDQERMAISTILLLLLLLQLGEYDANELFLQSDIELSDWGQQFQPAHPIELLDSFSTSAVLDCAASERNSFVLI